MIVGSAVMVMHDIDRKLGDLDLFMATEHWFDLEELDIRWACVTPNPEDPDRRFDPPLLARKVRGIEVNIFFTWRVREDDTDLNVNRLWQEAEIIDGVVCSPIKFLLNWKRAVAREKDLPDIEAILDKYPALRKP